MKLSQILALLLTSGVGAIRIPSLVPAIRNTELKASIPRYLAVVARRSGELASETLPRAAIQGAKWVAANPGTTATAGVGVLLIFSPAVAATPALGALGFGTSGVVAGSSAAAIQSSIGSVISPSLFATLQSAGAGGYGLATVYPLVKVAGGVIASSAGASVAWVKSLNR